MLRLALVVSVILFGNTTLAADKWTVRDSEETNYVPLMDLVESVNNQEWTIRGFVDPDKFFPKIMNKKSNPGRKMIDVSKGNISENDFELFLFDCELDPCTMSGIFQTEFRGFSDKELEMRFLIDSYQIANDENLPSTNDYQAQLVGKKVVHEQPIKYIDRSSFKFYWDPQDTWYPQVIWVRTNWEERSELRDFIKTCVDKCNELRVYGEVARTYTGTGNIEIVADRIEK